MKTKKIKAGDKFGRLTVLERSRKLKNRHWLWKCICDCGQVCEIRGDRLNNGTTKSCGCLKGNAFTTHGQSGTRLYNTWNHMKQRCYSENCGSYPDYGGLGVGVCKEWKNDFVPFMKWALENGYADNLSIDRINPFGDYEPSNCRWADSITQFQNTRKNAFKRLQPILGIDQKDQF